MGLLKNIFQEKKLEISVILLCVGTLVSLIGFAGLYADEFPSVLTSMADTVGDWYLWFVLIGPILLMVGIYFIFDSHRKRKEFEELIATTSKAKFVKNMDRIEELAWHLTRKHQMQVAEKKAKFRIK